MVYPLAETEIYLGYRSVEIFMGDGKVYNALDLGLRRTYELLMM
jgi:hypothetical protein